MLYSETNLKNEIDSVISHLQQEMKKLRVGRAKPETFAGIKVTAYGMENELKALADIQVPTGTSVLIVPFDKNVSKNIVDGIVAANLGYMPVDEGGRIRINIPPMTQETRQATVKELGELVEDSKISVRQIRHKYNEQIEKAEGVSEDEQKRSKAAVQKEVDQTNDRLDAMEKEKAEELMSV